MNLPGRALSVRQPWAWAIIHAGKNIENRSWQAVNHGLNFRGAICIHAAKGMTRQEYFSAAEMIASRGMPCPIPIDLVRGAIIGTVEVVDVVSRHGSPWFVGPRGLVLRDPRALAPIPVSGALGFFDWRERRTDAFPEPARWMRPNDQRHSEKSGSPDLFEGRLDV